MGMLLVTATAFAGAQMKDSPDKPSYLYVYKDTQKLDVTNEDWQLVSGPYSYTMELRSWQHFDNQWVAGLGGSGSEFNNSLRDYVFFWNTNYDDTQTNGRSGILTWDADGSGEVTGIATNTVGSIDGIDFFTWTFTNALNIYDYIGNEHCDVSCPTNSSINYGVIDGSGDEETDTTHGNYTRTAQTVWHLQTGGKSLPGRQSLWQLSGNANAVTNKRTVIAGPFATGGGPVNGISYGQIAIGREKTLGTLGSDGKLWTVLPDDQEVDVTPYVAGNDFYTFTVNAQKYKLHILANDYPLADDRVRPQAYYCVGQKIVFQAVFSPDITSSSYYNSPIWNYTADYINNHWTDANGCEEYNIAPIPAMSNPTTAWFYNKQTQDATANLGLYCKFNNGQSVYLVRRGMFNVFTPTISFIPSGGFTVNVRHYGAAVLFGVGQSDGTGSLIGKANINSIPKFPGQAMATQLVNRSASVDGVPFPVPFGTGGAIFLDNVKIYPGSQSSLTNDPGNPHSNLLGTVIVHDQPGIPITVASWASGNDYFNTYFRFRPEGDSDNIYVTLGRADWSWQGNVDYTGGIPYNPWTLSNWTISGAGTVGPTFNQENDFPVWLGVNLNFP